MLGLLLLTLSLTADNILFMDETGFYQRQYYTRSWSPIGKPCYAKIDANKGKRLNLMGAMRLNDFKLIAPVTFEGGCNRVIVENWLTRWGNLCQKMIRAIIQNVYWCWIMPDFIMVAI